MEGGKRQKLVWGASGAAAILFAWGFSCREPSGFARLLLLTLLQVTPFFLCLFQRRMDYLSVILGGEFVGYSLSPLCVFLLHPGEIFLSPWHLQGLDHLILSTLVLIALFYTFCLLFYAEPFRKGTFEPIDSRTEAMVLGGFALAASFWLEDKLSEEMQPFFLSCQFLLTVFVFCLSEKAPPTLRRSLQALAILGSFISFLMDTHLGFAINLLVIWVSQLSLKRDLKLLIKVAGLLLYMTTLQAVKYDYRAGIHRAPDPSLLERASYLVTLLERHFIEKPPAKRLALKAATPLRNPDAIRMMQVHGALAGALARAHDESLEKVLELTPASVPFWEGKSYFNFFYLLVPKIIWPSKPEWNLWNEFGHRYGYLSATDTRTLVLFSYFAEGYMNFGFLGIYLTAIFLSALFFVIEWIARLDEDGPYSFSFIALLMPLLAYQSDLGSLLVRLFYALLVVVPLRTIWSKAFYGRRAL